MNAKDIKTTGQLRAAIANATKDLLNGDMPIERASALHKLARTITESLYSETKIAMFQSELGQEIGKFGDLQLGDPNDDETPPAAKRDYTAGIDEDGRLKE